MRTYILCSFSSIYEFTLLAYLQRVVCEAAARFAVIQKNRRSLSGVVGVSKVFPPDLIVHTKRARVIVRETNLFS